MRKAAGKVSKSKMASVAKEDEEKIKREKEARRWYSGML